MNNNLSQFKEGEVIFSIRKEGNCLGYISIQDGMLSTDGQLGENKYPDFVELIKGLQGFGISIDNFYW